MAIEDVTPRNHLQRSRLDVRKFAFSHRIVDYMWNCLSDSFATANCHIFRTVAGNLKLVMLERVR